MYIDLASLPESSHFDQIIAKTLSMKHDQHFSFIFEVNAFVTNVPSGQHLLLISASYLTTNGKTNLCNKPFTFNSIMLFFFQTQQIVVLGNLRHIKPLLINVDNIKHVNKLRFI